MKLTINPSEFDVFIGIDVDQKSYATTYRHHDNQGRSFKIPAQSAALCHYFQKQFPGKRLLYIYEAGTTGY